MMQSKKSAPPPSPALNTLKVLNPYAAGIDVGSKSHYLAVGQRPEDVYEVSVNTEGHAAAIALLRRHHITTVAMESTGSYWQPLFMALQTAGFEVLLVSGSQTTNARRKTDVQDCQWIQKLHSLGMLTPCFLPGEATLKLRTIARHRASLIEMVALYNNKIQKCLRLMNIRLDIAIRDVAGKSGRAIIEAILAGERRAEALAVLVDVRVKKSQLQLVGLLAGQYREELLYELRDCYELMKAYEERILGCDGQIEKLLSEQQTANPEQGSATPPNSGAEAGVRVLAKKQSKGKHACTAALQGHCYRLLEVDIFSVPGVGPGVALSFLSEMGEDIFKFGRAKQFASWLRLTPNNRISGGKVLSSRTEKSRNQLTKALRDAANAVGRMKKDDDYLVRFFKKIAFKNGRGAAITATARKLAVVLWKMVVQKQPYRSEPPPEQQARVRTQRLKRLANDIKKYALTTDELSTLLAVVR